MVHSQTSELSAQTQQEFPPGQETGFHLAAKDYLLAPTQLQLPVVFSVQVRLPVQHQKHFTSLAPVGSACILKATLFIALTIRIRMYSVGTSTQFNMRQRLPGNSYRAADSSVMDVYWQWLIVLPKPTHERLRHHPAQSLRMLATTYRCRKPGSGCRQ